MKPALVFATAGGDVIHCQYARLYPAYQPNGRELPSWSEELIGLEELFDLVRAAETRARAQEERMRAMEQRSDASRVALAGILAERCRWREARSLLEQELATGEDVSALHALAGLHARGGRTREAVAAYERLIRAHGSDGRANLWRYQAARLRLDADARRRVAGAEAAAETVAARKILGTLSGLAEDPGLALRARLTLTRAALEAEDSDESARQLAWLAAHTAAEALPWTADLLLEVMELESRAERAQRAAEYGWRLVRNFPNSVEAQVAKHGMLGGGLIVAGPR